MAERRRRLSPTLIAGLVMAGVLVLIAILAPPLLGGAATTITPDIRQPPSAEHWFGTDEFGRDILARALVATRLTLVMATTATIISVSAGVAIGGVVWLLPRRGRDVVLRLIDSTVAFPALVLGLVIAAILGPGSVSALIAIGVAGIPSFARLASNMTNGIIHRDFVMTSRLLGVRGWPLLSRHVLPNIMAPLLMIVTSSFALTLLDISSLSFVGLGVQSPEFDYGKVLSESLASIYVQPWGTVPPSFMLIFAGVTVMLIGDGIAATASPSRRARRAKTGVPLAPAAHEHANPNAVLDVRALRVTAPDGTLLVDGVDLSVDRGEVLGIVGESGSGKSTTAMAVAKLLADGLEADADIMRLGDLDLKGKVAPRRLATDIGLVYQDPGTTFNPTLRMGPQLAEVARVHLGLSRSRARTRVVDALEGLRITDPERRLRQHAFTLSGGMLQRATIAASMITDPALIIADEPTTALDVTVQLEVLRQFRRVNRTTGTAMLFISHDLAVVAELCDRVIVMRGGRIIEEITAQQLSRREVSNPYTRSLLDATPTLEGRGRPASLTPTEAHHG